MMEKFERMRLDDVSVSGFDAETGSYYEIIGPDDGEKMVFECVQSGNVNVKYLRQDKKNIWLFNGAGKLLFCVERKIP